MCNTFCNFAFANALLPVYVSNTGTPSQTQAAIPIYQVSIVMYANSNSTTSFASVCTRIGHLRTEAEAADFYPPGKMLSEFYTKKEPTRVPFCVAWRPAMVWRRSRVLSRIPPIINRKRIGNESGTEAKRIGYPARFGSCFEASYFRQAPNNQGTTKYSRGEGLAEQ